MITLVNLQAEKTDTDYRGSGCYEHTVVDETIPGWVRVARFGNAGLTITEGGKSVAIPLAELFKLAEAHEPALRPPPDKNAAPTA